MLNPCSASGECEVFLADKRVQLQVLEYLLTGNEAKPLYEVLIDGGLGANVLNVGLNFRSKQAMYTAGLKGHRTDRTSLRLLTYVLSGGTHHCAFVFVYIYVCPSCDCLGDVDMGILPWGDMLVKFDMLFGVLTSGPQTFSVNLESRLRRLPAPHHFCITSA